MILRPSRVRKSTNYLIALALQTLTPVLNWNTYSIASAIIGAGLIIKAEMDRLRHKYKITENELLHEEGIIRKNVKSIQINNIIKINVEQGIFERMLQYGNIELETSNNSVKIQSINKPLIIAERIKKLQNLK